MLFCRGMNEHYCNSMRHALPVLITAIVLACFLGCTPINHLAKPRPISMYCQTPRQSYVRQASEILARNGYSIVKSDTATGYIEAIDTVDKVAYRYKSLVREWHIQHTGDSVVVNLWSVSTRLDDSDVKQTWDKKYSGEDVKEWMRPVLSSLESACGLGNPLTPR